MDFNNNKFFWGLDCHQEYPLDVFYISNPAAYYDRNTATYNFTYSVDQCNKHIDTSAFVTPSGEGPIAFSLGYFSLLTFMTEVLCIPMEKTSYWAYNYLP